MFREENEILAALKAAEQEYLQAKDVLERANRAWIDAESDVVSALVVLQRVKEELRVYNNSCVERVEISDKEKEIQKFRQDYPEVVAFARDRDKNK